MSAQKKPLWARVLSEPAAQKWLKKHAKEFPEASFVPDDIAFSDSFLPGNRFIFEIVTEGRPYSTPEREKLAELWLGNHSVSDICRRMGDWPRRKGYNRLKLLKLHAMTKWRKARRELFKTQEAQLDTPPVACAYRCVMFSFGGKERAVYLITRDSDAFWVNEEGEIFPEEVQEVLNNLPEEREKFEDLNVE